MEWRAFLLQLSFNDFFCVVPGAAGVGHEDSLVQAEDGDGKEIADEEVRLDKRKRQRGEEYGNENVEHALLRVLGADFHDLFAISDTGCCCAFEINVSLDEFDSAIGTGGDGLRAGARKQID